MKIGIEAKWFFEGPPSGRVVIRNLVKNLIELSTEHEFFIFLNEKQSHLDFPYISPRVHLIYLWAGNNMLSNVFLLPLCAWRLDLDVCVFQNFPPFFSNFKRYAYIHDVLFKTHPQFYTALERLYLFPLKYLSRLAHHICTVSNTERLRMNALGFGKKNIDVIYHGVDEVFQPKAHHCAAGIEKVRLAYNLPPKYLLYVGRLNVRKNILNLIRAVALLKNTAVPLVVVGSYDGKMSDLGSLLTELGLAGRVIFTGHVHDDDLPLIYALATVFCFVSYAEAFGLPALEAMASGVPVVASTLTCLPEICGEAALYANPDNPVEIAGMVDSLLNDAALWQEKRELGIKRAEAFTWRRSAQNLLESVHRTVTGEVTQ